LECTLMHKNIPVVDMEIDDEVGAIAKLLTTHDIRHLPLGIAVFKTGIDRKMLNDWWIGRSIPASRDGIREALETLEICNTALLLSKCYGLSLSDQYWVCPKGSGLQWKDINFFHNDFSKDIGEILFGHEPADPANVSLMSPDNTSDGWLRKKWLIADGKRILMKGGSDPYQQEPFNEVIASAIMGRLGIRHIPYTLRFERNKPYSLCENFITPETELIPAWRVEKVLKQDNKDSHLAHLLRCCGSLGISGVADALNKMLTLDYIIFNQDRHYNNFGFIRNADTLEWIGFAPVFDSGTSLWHKKNRIGDIEDAKCAPFRNSHDKQIELVSDLSWFDVSTLEGLPDEVMKIFRDSAEVDEHRAKSIANIIMKRAGKIELLQREKLMAIRKPPEKPTPQNKLPALADKIEAAREKVKAQGDGQDRVLGQRKDTPEH